MSSWVGYGAGTYGDAAAGFYDEWYGAMPETDQAVALLATLAGTGPVLELGIGTGRLALPLAERGLEVHGIDASEKMVARLRGKPGGEDILVVPGDFSEVGTKGRYSLVFVAFNTFFNLQSQEEQLRCFQNVAAHLLPGGSFVLEAFVPDLGRWSRNQTVAANEVRPDMVALEVSRHDPTGQIVESQRVVLSEGGIKLLPLRIRYAWPGELDLMGRLAGLHLENRWAGWERQPFSASSSSHVSLYRLLSR